MVSLRCFLEGELTPPKVGLTAKAALESPSGDSMGTVTDFFTVGITLDTDLRHSVFDTDGSAIIVHEKPDSYGEQETDTGDRIACGVIERR